MITPTCPVCGKELVLIFSGNIKYYFNEKTEKYDMLEVKDIHSGLMCEWCGAPDDDISEKDYEFFESLYDLTPPTRKKLRVVTKPRGEKDE